MFFEVVACYTKVLNEGKILLFTREEKRTRYFPLRANNGGKIKEKLDYANTTVETISNVSRQAHAGRGPPSGASLNRFSIFLLVTFVSLENQISWIWSDTANYSQAVLLKIFQVPGKFEFDRIPETVRHLHGVRRSYWKIRRGTWNNASTWVLGNEPNSSLAATYLIIDRNVPFFPSYEGLVGSVPLGSVTN